jgi:signal recognition particle subunit SRP72
MPPPPATARKAQPGKAKGRSSTRKATPKKPVSETETARRLFSSLCSQIDGAHFANAIKTCDKSACPISYYTTPETGELILTV